MIFIAMSHFFKLFFLFSIFQTILGTSGFFSRASWSFVSSAANRHVFGRPKAEDTF